MCLVDLVEETLEFVKALLYQLLTPTIRLPNLSQRATQCTVRLNYKYGSRFKNTVIRDTICVIFKVYIHLTLEKRKDIFHSKNRSTYDIRKLTEFANN